MLPPALALAWPLWRRHRWGLLVVATYLAAAAGASALLPAHFTPAAAPGVLSLIMMLFPSVFLYILAVFSYGFDAEVVTARQSCFPAVLLRLPLRTEALAGWPMAFGAAAMVLLWLVSASFLLQPWLTLWDASVPLWWPAVLGVACLAWLQAMLWRPFGLSGVRILLVTCLIGGFIATAQVGVASGASEGALVSLFGALAGAGWISAYLGLRQARRGDVPDWEGVFRPAGFFIGLVSAGRRAFTSAAQAQFYFEWRRTGIALPLLTMLLLGFVLFPLLFEKNDVIPTENTLLSCLAIPVFLAGLAGTTVSGKSPWVKDYYGIAPFNATLPMTTARMVAAKLKGAALSTLVAWGSMTVVVSGAVILTGHGAEVWAWWRQALDDHSPLRVLAGIAGVATLLVIWTWKRMVDSLLLGMTGRKWLIQGTVFASLTAICAVWGGIVWIYGRPQTHAAALTILPWLLGTLLLGRLAVAGWAVRRVLREGLLDPVAMKRWLAGWLLVAFVLFALLAWSIPAEVLPTLYAGYAVLHVMPMGHLAATPLALAWNRHR